MLRKLLLFTKVPFFKLSNFCSLAIVLPILLLPLASFAQSYEQEEEARIISCQKKSFCAFILNEHPLPSWARKGATVNVVHDGEVVFTGKLSKIGRTHSAGRLAVHLKGRWLLSENQLSRLSEEFELHPKQHRVKRVERERYSQVRVRYESEAAKPVGNYESLDYTRSQAASPSSQYRSFGHPRSRYESRAVTPVGDYDELEYSSSYNESLSSAPAQKANPDSWR